MDTTGTSGTSSTATTEGTLEQHRAIGAGLERLAAWLGEVERWYARVNDPREVARRAAQAAYQTDCAAFRTGLESAAQLHGLAIYPYGGAGGLMVARSGLKREDAFTNAHAQFTMHREGENTYSTRALPGRLARVTIGDYGDKTSHPRPKAGWDFIALAKRALARVESGEAGRAARKKEREGADASEAARKRVLAATGLPEFGAHGVMVQSTSDGDRVIVKLVRGLNEERAIALLKWLDIFDKAPSIVDSLLAKEGK